MSTKLIIIEGLPGSGKSTTAQAVNDILKGKSISTELYTEGNYNHPADFDGVAYFTYEEFSLLKDTYLTSEDVLDEIKIKYHNGYLIPYKKALAEKKVTFEDALLNEITKKDIYELPLNLHIELMVSRWHDFANRYTNKDKVVVIECCFIQNPVTVSMIRSNSSKDVSMDYINNLASKVSSLEPVLIYVDQKDIKKSFNKAVTERPKEWFEGFTNYYTNQGYGLSNNLRGLDGVIKVLEERSKLEHDIYDSLKLTKYKIDNTEFNLDLLKDKLTAIIEQNL